jgi:hypothetical protein
MVAADATATAVDTKLQESLGVQDTNIAMLAQRDQQAPAQHASGVISVLSSDDATQF